MITIYKNSLDFQPLKCLILKEQKEIFIETDALEIRIGLGLGRGKNPIQRKEDLMVGI